MDDRETDFRALCDGMRKAFEAPDDADGRFADLLQRIGDAERNSGSDPARVREEAH